MKEEHGFCPNCGQKAEAEIPTAVNMAINQFNAGMQQTAEKKKKPLLIIGVTVVAVLAILLLGRGSSPNFEKLYNQYCNLIWAEVASDGSYLYIDTKMGANMHCMMMSLPQMRDLKSERKKGAR